MSALPDGASAHADITEADFKAAMRQVTSPVGVVTARAGALRNGLTATAICSVTANPPTILVCVNRDASAEKLIAASNAFAVNFLTDEQHQIARLFSTSKLESEQRFAMGEWTALATGAPVLDGCVASFDCRVEGSSEIGTHRVYFGRVVGMCSLDKDGLLYRDGLFRRLASSM